MSSPADNSTSASALVPTQPPVENQWAADLCDCFTYRTESEKLRFSPIFMPCSCFCPCLMLGRIKSRLIAEPISGCHMGHRGRCFCVGACCLCPCLPLFSLNIRQKAMAVHNVPGGCCEEWKAMCCACSLFQIFISLDEWDLEKKNLTKTSSAKKKEEMKLKAIQMKKKKLQEAELPPIPTQLNDITELVMTYMGDIMDDDEDDLSDDEDDEDVVEYDVDRDIGKTKPQGHKYNVIPTDSRESSHMPTKIDVVQVTIPPGHFAGSVFQIENKTGDILEVVVPAGGKPGMKMQVPNQTTPRSSPPPPPMQQPTSIMVQAGTIQVAIPAGCFEGSVFCIQSPHGDVMEVVVPTGGRPGMKMQIPNAFSQLLTVSPPPPPLPPTPTTAPVPPIRNTTPPPSTDNKNTKKMKRQRSGSPKRSTSQDGSRKIQVTIPEGCGPGDIFELQPTRANSTEGNIKVRVPQGGKPGMRVLIRLPSTATASSAPPPEQQPKDTKKKEKKKKTKAQPLRKQPPVMRESPKHKQSPDKVTRHAFGSAGGGGKPIKKNSSLATVTIPSGVAVGEPFVALDTGSGQQVLVIMPVDAKPGMVMSAEVVEDSA